MGLFCARPPKSCLKSPIQKDPIAREQLACIYSTFYLNAFQRNTQVLLAPVIRRPPRLIIERLPFDLRPVPSRPSSIQHIHEMIIRAAFPTPRLLQKGLQLRRCSSASMARPSQRPTLGRKSQLTRSPQYRRYASSSEADSAIEEIQELCANLLSFR